MSDTMTSQESPILGLATELQRQLATKRDLMADTRRVSFTQTTVDDTEAEGGWRYDGGLDLLVDMADGPEEYKATDHAHGQIGTHLGVPAKLYDRLREKHPDLFTHLVNGLLYREPSKRMIRTMDGQARAFLSNRYRPRDNWDLLNEAVLPVLRDHPGSVEFKSCELTETRMYVKVVLPDFERPLTPRPGDVIRGGLIIKNSEVGAGSLVIAPYTDELWCSNGAVHTKLGQSQRHVGKRIESDEEAWEFYSTETLQLDDDAFFAKCRDTVRGVLNETVFDAIVANLHDLRGIKVDAGPVDAVEIIARRHDFTEGEQKSMLAALIEGGDATTALGLVRAVTSMARDLDSPDRRVDLETLAGRMVADPMLVAA